jgi:hypothetical protein
VPKSSFKAGKIDTDSALCDFLYACLAVAAEPCGERNCAPAQKMRNFSMLKRW